jgi:hypothetical protein
MGGSRSALQDIVRELLVEQESSDKIIDVVGVEISYRFPGLSIVDHDNLVLAILDDCGVRVPKPGPRSPRLSLVSR